MVNWYPKRKFTIKRDMKKYRKYLHTGALIIAAVSYLLFRHTAQTENRAEPQDNRLFCVSRVVDGDTLKLSDGRKVRLIGVDTPELHYSEKLLRDAERSKSDIKTIQALGKIASDFTKDLCQNKMVRLEFDVQKNDRYGRLLAYAYLEDGTFINAKILEEGYGSVMTIPPNIKYSERFLRLEKTARNMHKGLWSEKK